MAGASNLLGQQIGRYHVESVVGSGGFATVYRAIDTGLDRPVALKVVDPSSHKNPTIGRRFLLEGRAVASLNHPAIVPVYDAGDLDGVLWLAMRLIQGESLDEAMGHTAQFPADYVLSVSKRIGAGLDHAHAKGIVHRDVKPSNILLEGNDPTQAFLTDFGIAATARTAGTYTTGVLGTAAYMAPEQSKPSSVGPSADLYSLGCVVYEMITGRRPFPGEDYVELLMAHMQSAVPPCGNAGLDSFFKRVLAKDPQDRPRSCREFAEALDDVLQAGGLPATAPMAVAAADPENNGKSPAADDPDRDPNRDYVPTGVGEDLTQIDERDRTMVYPHAPPDAPPPPAPAPAPPPPQQQPVAYQYPSQPPAPAPAQQQWPRPRDPTVARRSRERGRNRLVAGLVVLVIAVGGIIAAVLTTSRGGGGGDGFATIKDEAGVNYSIREDWTEKNTGTRIVWSADNEEMLVVDHTRDPDADDAVDAMESECNEPAEIRIPGADNAAICEGETTAIGAMAGDDYWIFVLRPSVSADDRDAIRDSIKFG